MEADVKERVASSPRLAIVIFFIFVVIEGFGSYYLLVNLFGITEIGNLLATVIEISGAIFITLVIFVYDTREKKRTDKVLNQIKDMSASVQKITENQNKILTELYERGRRRKYYHFRRIKADLNRFKNHYQRLIESVENLRTANNQENYNKVIAEAKRGQVLYESMRAGIIADFDFVRDYVNSAFLIDKFVTKLDLALGTFSEYSESFYTSELYKATDHITESIKDIDKMIADLDEEESGEPRTA